MQGGNVLDGFVNGLVNALPGTADPDDRPGVELVVPMVPVVVDGDNVDEMLLDGLIVDIELVPDVVPSVPDVPIVLDDRLPDEPSREPDEDEEPVDDEDPSKDEPIELDGEPVDVEDRLDWTDVDELGETEIIGELDVMLVVGEADVNGAPADEPNPGLHGPVILGWTIVPVAGVGLVCVEPTI